ncbi:MAG: beta-lactamase family protein [Chloroflexi bacterium]|nr:beta-lactamase family protein [Chloroflexota bacterium]
MATPDSQAVDPVALAAAYDEAARSNVVQSLLVARHGRIIGEHYFGRQDSDTAINIHSISKSVLSALVGIAIQQGFIASLDIPIVHWLPEYFGPHGDSRKRAITLRHLLTLTAGLGWIENETNTAHWRRSADWIAYALDLPLVSLPGRQFNYNTALTHLISVILTRATNLSTLTFAQRCLFDALGIQIARWDNDPQGYSIGGSDLFLRPRDLLRFGQLVLDRGMVNSKNIVPEQWLQESIQPHIQLRTPGFWHPAYKNYGYLWWLRKFQSYETAVASGYAGQLICIVPRLDLVIVTTATDTTPFASVMKQSHLIEAIVEDLIIPSVQEASDNGSSYS